MRLLAVELRGCAAPLPLQLLQTDAQPVGSKLSAEAPGEKESSQTCNGTQRGHSQVLFQELTQVRALGEKLEVPTKLDEHLHKAPRTLPLINTEALRILLPSRGTGSTRCFRNAAVIFGLLPVFVFFLAFMLRLASCTHMHKRAWCRLSKQPC